MTASGGPNERIAWSDFEKVDIRLGQITEVRPFPEARIPAYRLQIDFGPEIGVRKSSARITERYAAGQLEGRLVLAVVNFPPRQIGPFLSEVLTLGVAAEDGAILLVGPDEEAPLGAKLH